MVSATWPRFSPLAARSDAAPSVGPTQGLHTAPSISPSANWPPMPFAAKPPNCPSTQFDTGPPAAATWALRLGTSNSTPRPIRSTAEMARNTPASRPMAKPMVATKMPMMTKESASPAASATGA